MQLDKDSIRLYYQHFYPYETIYKWLTYNETILPFSHRELSFEYTNQAVQRYVKFNSPEEMKKKMTYFDEDIPRKIDAGAIWSGPPSKQNKQFKPVQRQFIFDFDMNDYDDVRTCCEGKRTCKRCWKFMLVAKDVISKTLLEDFGFCKLMYVFSGGRGMHIWVCDEEARKMTDSLRKTIVDYIEVVTGNDKASTLLADNTLNSIQKVFQRNDSRTKQAIKKEMAGMFHPHINRSVDIIKKWFVEIFNDQKPFTHDKCKQVIFKILEARSQKLKERVIQRWSKCEQTMQKLWKELIDQVDHYEMASTDQQYPLKSHELISRKYQRITFIEEEIMLSFLYPRMDYNVSTMQNHLLKLPFSIHHSTGKVSVPMFSSQVEKFDPQTCVSLETLMKELRNLQGENALSQRNNTVQNAHKSSLSQYLRAMQLFCAEL